MVKQGHYAKVSRQKKLRQLKQRHQAHEERAIKPDATNEFLQVRYHLTRAKQQRPVTRKTMQRFVAQWLEAVPTGTDWNITEITKTALQQFNRQLPWQGYALIDQEIMDFQAFLTKEVPAVPLANRLTVQGPLTVATWQALLTTQLAVNSLLGLVPDLSQVTQTQMTQLQTSLTRADDNQVDWEKVASLLAPMTIIAPDADDATRTWMTQLKKISVNKLD